MVEVVRGGHRVEAGDGDELRPVGLDLGSGHISALEIEVPRMFVNLV